MTGQKYAKIEDVQVGQRIRQRRLMVGMTQEKLGKALGLSFQQVQKYEKGVNRVSASRMIRIAQTLGVPVSFLFHGIEAPNVDGGSFGDVGREFLATSTGVRIAKAFTALKDEKIKARVADLVEQMVDNAL